MHLVCVSAPNMRRARERSTSLRVCRLIARLATEARPDATVDVIALVECKLKPCTGCGACYQRGKCPSDSGFNQLYARLIRADGLFIVAAHYAPIPAKLCMMLEKVEQFAFLRRYNDEAYRSPLYGKPAGLIAHGGGGEEVMDAYRAVALEPIANALSWPVEMEIVSLGDDAPRGVVFPVQRVHREPGTIYPIQEYDWADIERRVAPLVTAVLAWARG